MLQKIGSGGTVFGVIGQRCVEFAAPPIVPTPPSPEWVPPPPVPGIDPPAAPTGPAVGAIVSISTYQDTLGNCWRVTKWSTAPAFGSTIELSPIDCSEL